LWIIYFRVIYLNEIIVNDKFMSKTDMIWQNQDLPPDHSTKGYCTFRLNNGKNCRFRIDDSKFAGVTRHALTEFTRSEINTVFEFLQQEAEIQGGLNYLQTFKDERGRRLWVVESDKAITAMLPEDW
jgi:hypothetical protein